MSEGSCAEEPSQPGLGPVDDDHVRMCGYRGIRTKLFTFFSSDGHCPVAFDCRERTRLFAFLPTTSTKLTLVHPTLSLASDLRLMSAQESVIAALNETTESESVDSPAVPPSEDLVVKDTPAIVDSSPAEPATELPAEPTQTASDDTPAILLNHDTNIPDATPTNLNSFVNGVKVTPFVSVGLLTSFFSFPAPELRGCHCI